jgi:cell division protein FtsB
MLKNKGKIFFIALLLLNFFMLYKIFDKKSGIPAYRELQGRIAVVQDLIDEMDMQNKQISSEIRVLKKNDQYVARLAKRELFYLSDNELMYIMK